MKYIALDLESSDPYLKDHGAVKARGTSCVFGRGRIIVIGTYDGKQKKSYDGNGGECIKNLFLNPNVTIIGANIQYDAVWLILKHNINPKDVKCHFIDVSVVESLIDEYQKYDLDSLAIKYLNEHKGKSALEGICQRLGLHGDFREHLGDLWDKGYKQEIRDYVISDADQPWRIWEKQKPILEAQGLMRAFEMNMEMLPVTIFMKVRGAKFDFAKWQENCAKAGEPYNQLKSDYDRNYGEVNINSPKQLAAQMDKFDVPYRCKINIKGWKVTGRKFKNATDLFSDEEVMKQKKALKDVFGGLQIVKDSERRKRLVLFIPKRYAERTTEQISNMGYEVSCNPCINKAFYTEFAGSYQIVADLVQYKQAKNIVDKFLGPKFGRFIVAVYKDGSRSPAFDEKGEFIAEGAVDFRLCCTFNIVGARQTGRLSATTPNLQQVPSKTVLFEKTDHAVDLAKMCRECFTAEKGHAFVKFDYSAQENRLAAHFAPGRNGERIRNMYKENPFLDEHSYVTEISGLAEQHGKKAGRKYAKNLRFGVGYGMQLARMMTQFGWTQEFAEDLYKKVSEAAPWLFELMEQVQDVVIRRRYIRTLIGRRVHMRPGKDKDAYKFMNYLIQGSASDMTKLATVAVFAGMKHAWEVEHSTIDEMAITVHDEDDFDIDCTDVERAVKRTMEIRTCMENTSGCDLPIISCPEIGTSWADGVEWEPSLGDCEDFVRRAYTAIHNGTFPAFKKLVSKYSSREEDDGLTFAQFCYNVEEEEAEENEEIIF